MQIRNPLYSLKPCRARVLPQAFYPFRALRLRPQTGAKQPMLFF